MWVAGFASGDGSFYTKLTQYKDTFHTGCIFKITLHLKDTALLEGLYDYLSKYFPNISFNKYNSLLLPLYGGYYEQRRTNKGIFFFKQTVSLNISNIQDIGNIVIPFSLIFSILATTAPLSLLLAAYARKSKSGNDGSKNKKNKGA
jgi:hypothetical protein